MHIQLLEVDSGRKVEAIISVLRKEEAPQKKENWNFNWKELLQTEGSFFFKITRLDTPQIIEGIIMLSLYFDEMVYLNALELAPHNVGKTKKNDLVAGCLLAYSCQYSIEHGKGEYRGYLTFDSKTALISLYQKKYGATLAGRQKMFIDPIQGKKLISIYLEDSST